MSKSWLLSYSKARGSDVRQRRLGSTCNLLSLSCPRFHRLERKEGREHRERSRVIREGISSYIEENFMSGQHCKATCQGAHCTLINCPAGTMPVYNHSAVQTLMNSWAPGQDGIIQNHLEISHGIKTVETPIAIRFTLDLKLLLLWRQVLPVDPLELCQA